MEVMKLRMRKALDSQLKKDKTAIAKKSSKDSKMAELDRKYVLAYCFLSSLQVARVCPCFGKIYVDVAVFFNCSVIGHWDGYTRLVYALNPLVVPSSI